MPDASSGSVNVELDGDHLRVDARPARLVSLLRGAGGDPVLTAQRTGGDTHTEAVPAAARQVTFQVQDELSVEANRTSDFVALAEESGRRVVVAFNGEVTVLPNGSGGDRFALGAHEALLMPAEGGEPKVVPVDDLSDEDQDQISAVMEGAAMAVVAPTGSDPAPTADEAEPTADEGEPTQAMPVVDPEPEAPTKPDAPVTKAAPGPAAASTKATSTPGKAGNAQKRSGKKGKKGRPQPQKRSAPLVPAAAAGAAGGAAAAGVTKKSVPATPSKKSGSAPVKKAAPAKAGGGGGGGHDGDSYEDTPSDRRFIAGAVILALLVVIVLGVFVLTGDNDKDSTVAADSSTTTTEEADDTSSTSAPATTSTVAAAVTTVAPTSAPTSAPATTTSTTAATTTSAPAAAAKYGIEPKSCVQNANNSITYTATVTNQSTAAFDYTITVVFKDGGGASVAKTDAKVDNVAAGKSADFTATGTPPRDLANAGTCTVERVDARPS